MEKVKITKTQAEGLEHLRNPEDTEKYRYSAMQIVKAHATHYCEIKQRSDNWSHGAEAVNELDLVTLTRALYEGYEIEETKEDIIQRVWSVSDRNGRWAIEETLNALGIKIEGVNA